MLNFSPIRPATPADAPYFYEICLKTSLAGADGSDYFQDPYMTGAYWSAPYLWHDMDLCFIAEDFSGRPAGYIVGTKDTTTYNQWLAQEWLPTIQKQYATVRAASEPEKTILSLIRKGNPGAGVWENVGYPAHLHINILPSLQGRGIGRRLMENWLGKAEEKHLQGVHFGVDARNKSAIGFYGHLGFTVLENTDHSLIFGMKLPRGEK
ncbi:GNAT family N-acetyltransferase [Parasphaerochaeta coccoides]|uniref:GCN5-related N-acetyltransferase n=1 Tax=Parasphaerochaeta coccoides (strain ATCC BAA-1237 / DSM 17374 / SPN1) TaxID=760011 RepID=F4GLK5_PARC1|nr:GNAT family N-acetyltransferase [Parasphaerochaeta coccoides]AEC01975.1 GCN5-related N-acetyltransferase [Parasphaerochaeta coccoides DSM 17374]